MAETKTEESKAAASYMMTFHEDIQTLNHNFAIYQNLLLELEATKGKDFEAGTLEDNEYQALLNTVQNARFSVTKTFVASQAMKPKLEDKKKKTEKDELEDAYNAVVKNLIISRDDLKDYVVQINKFVVNKVMDELLKKSQDLIADL